MKLRFTKMEGCGNDYIYFDCLEQMVPEPEKLSVRLSDRHTGIGGDGIILICPSRSADAKMRIFNADGSEGKMCGNGIRCVGKFLYDNRIVPKEVIRVETLSGVKALRMRVRGGCAVGASVDMGRAAFAPEEVPVRLPEEAVGFPLSVGGSEYRITCVSMGNPHCVIFGGDPSAVPLEEIGPLFEHHALFPEGVNTEFVQVIGERELSMRVWERGSGETMACGTGACAAAAAAVKNGFCPAGEPLTVHLRGGDLEIVYTPEQVVMTGPAVTVFTGEIQI